MHCLRNPHGRGRAAVRRRPLASRVRLLRNGTFFSHFYDPRLPVLPDVEMTAKHDPALTPLVAVASHGRRRPRSCSSGQPDVGQDRSWYLSHIAPAQAQSRIPGAALEPSSASARRPGCRASIRRTIPSCAVCLRATAGPTPIRPLTVTAAEPQRPRCCGSGLRNTATQTRSPGPNSDPGHDRQDLGNSPLWYVPRFTSGFKVIVAAACESRASAVLSGRRSPCGRTGGRRAEAAQCSSTQ